jgi:hypothetical protein
MADKGKNKAAEKQGMPEKAETKDKKEKKPSKERPVPILMETAFTFSKIVVILMGLVVGGLSLLAGNDVISSALRSMVAILATGFMLWLITWLVIRGSMNTVITSIQQASKNSGNHTKDLSA